MKKLFRVVVFLLLFMAGAGCIPFANAQFGGDPGPVPCEPDPLHDCPIDGGLSLLLGAGVLYGFLRHRKSPSEPNHHEAGDQ